MDDLIQDRLIIRLDDVFIETSIGLLPFEKEHPNKLSISLELHASVPPGRLDGQPIIDYVPFYDYLRSIPQRGHVDLLETLADLITEQCFAVQRIEACRIVILKTALFPDCAGVGIDIFRTRKSWSKLS